MPPIAQRFAIPKNHDIFEEICRDLLRVHWSRPDLEIFGKRGERQFGIDILDLGGQDPLYAAQCKLKEEHKTLPPTAIQEEVNQAKSFQPPLGKYGILTTAKVSADAQRKIREINHLHKAEGLFEVELFTWERISALLQQHADMAEHYYGEITSRLAKRIESEIVEVRGGVEHLRARVEANDIDSQINEARECVTQKKFQLATFLLNRIQQLKGHLLSSHQTFRILSIHGWAALGEGKRYKAAEYFLSALAHQPTDERARGNEVIAYFLIGDFSKAHSKAENIRSVYPASTTLAEATIWHCPLKETIQIFANPKADFRSLLGIFVDFAVKLYREPLLPDNRCIVVCAFLDALWRNVAARPVLLNIRKSMLRLFGLNQVGESQFNECFDRWVKLKENSIISAP
jgi:hypothetical protein